MALWIPLESGISPGMLLSWHIIAVFCIAVIAYTFIRRPTTVSLPIRITELIAFASILTGETKMALGFNAPMPDPLHFPPLRPIFIISGVIAPVLLIHLFMRRIPAYRIAIIVTLWSSSLIYTQPLDKMAGAILYPFLSVLAGWGALFFSFNPRHTVPASFRSGTVAPIFVAVTLLLFNAIRWWSTQPEWFYLDFILFCTGLLFWVLMSISVCIDPEKSVKEIVQYHIFLIFFLSALFTWRIAGLWLDYGKEFSYIYRVWLMDNHPNALALFLVYAVSFTYLVRTLKNRFRMAVVVPAGVMILMTFSRNTWVSICLASMLLILFRRSFGERLLGYRDRYRLLFFLIPALFISAMVVYRVSYRLVDMTMIEHRLGIWSFAFKGIRLHPCSGQGLGRHGVLSRLVLDPFDNHISFLEKWFHWDRLGRHFHNVILEWTWIFGMGGALLFALTAYLFCITLNRIRRRRRLEAGVLFFTGAVCFFSGLFDYVYYYPALLMAGATYLALLTGISASFESEHIVRNRRLWSRFRFIAWIGLVLLAYVCVLLPVKGIHWKSEGDAQYTMGRIDQAVDAYRKAMRFYTACTPQVSERLIEIYTDRDDPAEVRDILIGLAEYPAVDPRCICMLGWLTRSEAERGIFIREALARDPAGLWGMEFYSDEAINSCASGGTEWIHSLETAYYLNPALPMHFIHAFNRDVNGVVIDSSHWRKYLAERFHADVFHDATISGCFVPVERLLFEMESTLDRMPPGPSRRIRRVRLLEAWIKKNDVSAAGRLVNKWHIDPSQIMLHEDMLVDIQSDSIDFLIIRGIRAMKDDRMEEARRLFHRAYIEGSRDPRVFFGLGTVSMMCRRWEDARRYLEEALRLAPGMVEAYINLGIVYMRLHKNGEAERCLKNAIRLNPVSEKAVLNLGWLYLENGHPHKAYHVAARGRRLHPDNEALRLLYETCMQQTRLIKSDTSVSSEEPP